MYPHVSQTSDGILKAGFAGHDEPKILSWFGYSPFMVDKASSLGRLSRIDVSNAVGSYQVQNRPAGETDPVAQLIYSGNRHMLSGQFLLLADQG